ncbi:hypothetical protein AKJ16_DCAP17512 [Drosera capensis]
METGVLLKQASWNTENSLHFAGCPRTSMGLAMNSSFPCIEAICKINYHVQTPDAARDCSHHLQVAGFEHLWCRKPDSRVLHTKMHYM